MKKNISNAEPICGMGNTSGCKNPHYVATVENYDPTTGIVKLRCVTETNQGISATIPNPGTHNGFPDNPVGKHVLVQEKFIVGTPSLVKIKDVADTNEKWTTGKQYSPAFKEAIVLHEAEQFTFNRSAVAAEA